jgi:hypothetical protein
MFAGLQKHDARAMRNSGFQTMLRRGTEWAAIGKISSKIPQELKQPENEKQKFKWLETEPTIALLSHDKIIWQYNFNTKHGRPFFHPVFVGRNNITCVSPDDHRWHLGQWVCWKYINKVNSWEYRRGSYQSKGVTEGTNKYINQ